MKSNLKSSIFACLTAVFGLSSCSSGVSPQNLASNGFAFGALSNPTSLAAGESITFSVSYRGEALGVSSCSSIYGETSSTDTTCTYTAPLTMPALSIVEELAGSESTLSDDVTVSIANLSLPATATLGVVITFEDGGEEAVCGDGTCDDGEDHDNCPEDCDEDLDWSAIFSGPCDDDYDDDEAETNSYVYLRDTVALPENEEFEDEQVECIAQYAYDNGEADTQCISWDAIDDACETCDYDCEEEEPVRLNPYDCLEYGSFDIEPESFHIMWVQSKGSVDEVPSITAFIGMDQGDGVFGSWFYAYPPGPDGIEATVSFGDICADCNASVKKVARSQNYPYTYVLVSVDSGVEAYNGPDSLELVQIIDDTQNPIINKTVELASTGADQGIVDASVYSMDDDATYDLYVVYGTTTPNQTYFVRCQENADTAIGITCGEPVAIEGLDVNASVDILAYTDGTDRLIIVAGGIAGVGCLGGGGDNESWVKASRSTDNGDSWTNSTVMYTGCTTVFGSPQVKMSARIDYDQPAADDLKVDLFAFMPDPDVADKYLISQTATLDGGDTWDSGGDMGYTAASGMLTMTSPFFFDLYRSTDGEANDVLAVYGDATGGGGTMALWNLYCSWSDITVSDPSSCANSSIMSSASGIENGRVFMDMGTDEWMIFYRNGNSCQYIWSPADDWDDWGYGP